MEKRIAVVKDYYGNEIKVGDKVLFIFKNYGYRKLSGAGFCEGVVTKLPTEEYREVSKRVVDVDGKYTNEFKTEMEWVKVSEYVTVEYNNGTKRVYPFEMIITK